MDASGETTSPRCRLTNYAERWLACSRFSWMRRKIGGGPSRRRRVAKLKRRRRPLRVGGITLKYTNGDVYRARGPRPCGFSPAASPLFVGLSNKQHTLRGVADVHGRSLLEKIFFRLFVKTTETFSFLFALLSSSVTSTDRVRLSRTSETGREPDAQRRLLR